MNELDLMMQRIFKGKIGGNDMLTYKYCDEGVCKQVSVREVEIHRWRHDYTVRRR